MDFKRSSPAPPMGDGVVTLRARVREGREGPCRRAEAVPLKQGWGYWTSELYFYIPRTVQRTSPRIYNHILSEFFTCDFTPKRQCCRLITIHTESVREIITSSAKPGHHRFKITGVPSCSICFALNYMNSAINVWQTS